MKNIIPFLLLLLLPSCAGENKTSAGSTVLPVEEYAQKLNTDTTAYMIDVRTPEEYAEGHIEGAVLMNVMNEQAFLTGIDTLDASHTYYIYCRSGRRSQKASGLMGERGLKVVDLQGGYNAWQEAEKK